MILMLLFLYKCKMLNLTETPKVVGKARITINVHLSKMQAIAATARGYQLRIHIHPF